MKIRTGLGFDVHKLVEGRDLWLGGIRIEHTHGLLGHSDADVLIHAICDALLGAANLRDIGYHFPDTGKEFAGIDSKILLQRTTCLLKEKGYTIGNVDATVCAEQPKLNPHIPAMKSVLAPLMNIDEEDVSIKATTTEQLGFTGRKEGISAYAVVLIEKLKNPRHHQFFLSRQLLHFIYYIIHSSKVASFRSWVRTDLCKSISHSL